MESTSEGNSQRLMGAMEMEMGTLLQDGTEEKWEAISDLDAFFSRVYDYFNERGLRCIITARIINLLTLLFTITCTATSKTAWPITGLGQHAGSPEAAFRASSGLRPPQASANLSASAHASGRPKRRPTSANQPLGPRWPVIQALPSPQVHRLPARRDELARPALPLRE